MSVVESVLSWLDSSSDTTLSTDFLIYFFLSPQISKSFLDYKYGISPVSFEGINRE